jgi:dehydrogenase/reductase SDR family protein 7B
MPEWVLRGSVVTTDLEFYRTIHDINVMGLLFCVQAVYPHMKAQGQGTIVNVSSVAGFKGFYDSGLYSATKFAVNGLSESLTMELADQNIQVLLVCPGKTCTDFDDNLIYDGIGSTGSRRTQRKGVSSEFVAGEILKGIQRNKKLIVVGRLCKPLYWLNRISPILTNKLIQRMY